MNKLKLLSGDQLVHKCGLKNKVSLPEIGLKDIVPNGSWLEQKQTQSALEGRYQLVEAERIEKCGALSHAVWREDKMLAEVTKQVGGYWQHLGHHMNKKIYLKPEEALYLIEVNCLQLKYNEVTVSLQQAYSLLLGQEITILKYKVYASLSRLGYKVFRYAEPKLTSPDKFKDNKSKQGDKTDSQLKNTDTLKEEVDVESDGKTDNVLPDEKSTENANKPDVISSNANVEQDSNYVQDTAVNSTIDVDLTLTDTFDVDKVENEADSKQIQNKAEHSDIKGVVKIEGSEHQDLLKSDPSVRNIECDTQYDAEIPHKSIKDNNHCIEHADIANVYPSTSIPGKEAVSGVKKKHNQKKKHIYKNRFSFKNTKPRDIYKYFKNIPEMLQKNSVIISVPREHIPGNISSKKSIYEINLKAVTTRQASLPSTDTNSYTEIDTSTNARGTETSMTNVRTQTNQASFFASNDHFPRQPFSDSNPFNYWRSRYTFNVIPFTLYYDRPTISGRNMTYPLRLHIHPRPQQDLVRPFPPPFVHNTNALFDNNSNTISNNQPSVSNTISHNQPSVSDTISNNQPSVNNTANNNTNSLINSRKRTRVTDPNDQMFRLNCIKRLAFKLKMQQLSRDIRSNLNDFLQTQIQTYNSKYTPKIRLTDEMELVENAAIETISLDDNDGARMGDGGHKKARSDIIEYYDEHLSNIKQLAQELKALVSSDLSTSRHRRALSSVVKTFNKSFNADIYVDINCEVVDRRNIILASNSDSDCVIEENKSKQKKLPAGKKVRNPFNVLKRLSDKNRDTMASCSNQNEIQGLSIKTSASDHNKYSDFIKNTFSKRWLPTENDFGRAEILSRNFMLSRLIDSNKQEFIYEFIKNQSRKFINWIDVKIMFLQNMEAATALFQDENGSEGSTEFDSIIKPVDCTDMLSVLKKLSIIPNYNDISHDTRLKIDFDVYNRDVKNLRKSDLPKPHFRIICLKESSGLPSGAEVAALHSKYDSCVPIIFAVVGQSISYLQIKPIDSPMYIPGSDAVLD